MPGGHRPAPGRGIGTQPDPLLPAGGPGATEAPTAVLETHISRLFFVDDRVYKLKKPIVTGFVDFSTEAARQRACEREVELNRRLAPDVYLGVATVVGPDGAACEHLVVMRRLPARTRLSTLVESGADVAAELDRIASVVARFHAGAATSPEIAAHGTALAVLGRWKANTEQMLAFPETVLDHATVERVGELAARYLAGRAPLLASRVADGKVRDGHGDLLADDIFCLDDGPRIIDCLEFDDHLRYADVLEDAAFLAMDLERLGAPGSAEAFLAAYRHEAGDRPPASLEHLFIAYRAQVRAKVAAIRALQGLGGRPEAARLLAMAEDHLRAARIRIALVGGLPGTGKSTVAAALGERLGWPVLRSDVVRREVAGPTAPTGYRQGRYAPAVTDAVYRELLERAGRQVQMGESVILDATWSTQAWRVAAADLAVATASHLVELRCDAPAGDAKDRLARRASEGTDASEATPEIAAALAEDWDPWPSAVTVDASGSAEAAVARALGILDRT